MGKKKEFEKGKATVHPKALGKETQLGGEKEHASGAKEENLSDYCEAQAWESGKEKKTGR